MTEVPSTPDQPRKPNIKRHDIPEIPGTHEGLHVKLEKIDPKTGVLLGPILEGPLLDWDDSKGKMQKGRRICFKDSTPILAGRTIINPKGTSAVACIDEMDDGSFWIFTKSSCYQYRPAGSAERHSLTVSPASSPDTAEGVEQKRSWAARAYHWALRRLGRG